MKSKYIKYGLIAVAGYFVLSYTKVRAEGAAAKKTTENKAAKSPSPVKTGKNPLQKKASKKNIALDGFGSDGSGGFGLTDPLGPIATN